MKLILCFFLFTCITGTHSRTLQEVQEDAFEGSKTNYAWPSLSRPAYPDASPSDRQIYPNTLIVMVTTNTNYENDNNFDFNNENKYEREAPSTPPAPESSVPHHPLKDSGIERKAPSPPPAPKSTPPTTNQVSGDRKPPAPPSPKHGPPTHQVSSSAFERKARSPPPAPWRAPPTNQVSGNGLIISSSFNQLVAST